MAKNYVVQTPLLRDNKIIPAGSIVSMDDGEAAALVAIGAVLAVVSAAAAIDLSAASLSPAPGPADAPLAGAPVAGAPAEPAVVADQPAAVAPAPAVKPKK